jgi:hypothetical protein
MVVASRVLHLEAAAAARIFLGQSSFGGGSKTPFFLVAATAR